MKVDASSSIFKRITLKYLWSFDSYGILNAEKLQTRLSSFLYGDGLGASFDALTIERYCFHSSIRRII